MKNNSKNREKEIAIKVQNVSKVFKIPHEKIDTVKSAFVNAFQKTSYEEFNALEDVSFEVKKGEFFGIIGRNGSGKSTLLKIMAGIYQQNSGTVEINGMISPFLELGIGFNPELSGRDNVYLNATVLGLKEEEIDEKFDSIVKFSELERFIDQKLKNYSSGMQVRLAFSVSIHANRDILLMDEVLAVGDNNFQSKCLEEFNRYKDSGKTVILVTHDIATVQKYCDRAMLLRNGRVIKIGRSEEVGSEYMYQNMSDEERRIVDEERRRFEECEKVTLKNGKITKVKKQKKKSKLAEIINVKFLNKNEKEKNVFRTGELLAIEVVFRIEQEVKDPIFGIVIKDGIKNDVFALNTQFKRIKVGLIPIGLQKVRFVIKNYFASGSYSVSPAIATGAQKIIDWRDDFKKFKILNSEFNSGAIADFESEIIIL